MVQIKNYSIDHPFENGVVGSRRFSAKKRFFFSIFTQLKRLSIDRMGMYFLITSNKTCAISPKICALLSLLFIGCGREILDRPSSLETYTFDIPAGEAVESFTIAARQCGVEFIFHVDELRGVQTHHVSGIYTIAEVFRLLVEGTPLKVEYNHTSGMYYIKRSNVSCSMSSDAKSQFIKNCSD